jgi:lipopolysaccharide transport system permease protein
MYSTGQAEPRELVIRPESVLSLQELRDVWEARELLVILALRDVSVRYKQASLGIAWALLQPLTQMILFTVLFNRLAGIHSDGDVPYPVFCFAGLTVWTLFVNGLSQATDSLVASASLVTKVYFPRVIIPMATIFVAIVDFAVALVLLALLMFIFHLPLHAGVIFALPIAAVAAACAIAVGLWTSALNVQYRDIRHALPFFIQLLVYATPVFYPATLVPPRWRWLLDLNPMTAVVDSFRAAMFGTPLPWVRLGSAAIVVLIIALAGLAFFRRVERSFADRI